MFVYFKIDTFFCLITLQSQYYVYHAVPSLLGSLLNIHKTEAFLCSSLKYARLEIC